MLRRVGAAVLAVVLLVVVVASVTSSGRALESYRLAASGKTVGSVEGDGSAGASGNGSGRDSSDSTAAQGKSGGERAGTDDASGAGAESSPSQKTAADSKAEDIASTLASDKSAQPLSETEKTRILDQARSTAQTSADETGAGPYVYTYCLKTRGDVGNTTAFANTVFSTLNNVKGWPRAGVTFEQTSEADCDIADMDIIPSQAKYMTDFSPSCSVEYSCRVDQQVIVNLDRWNGSVDSWLDAGGTLARYREMVVNHEVGHRLGHIDNETTCAGTGQRAPLMQEQSMHLDGCVPNEWPLDHELWVG
ncbi:DUF3152 domain-containing protein [Bifidobacterium sp. SO1]|uniref:DUF3152 domain-containing protein n=1 Tax=Bifidobacterium sp. SO1 TaxID=2809029 RepID=UPI001BDC710D|nr:DUF3152 domain-containing protein [Bifidobacterium sp. SO1]